MMSRKCPVACVLAVAVLSGCTDLKPLEAEIADLKSQVTRLQSDAQAARQAGEQTASTAQSASQAAADAQSTANQATAAAQASHACCDALNQKLDRMFKHSVSK